MVHNEIGSIPRNFPGEDRVFNKSRLHDSVYERARDVGGEGARPLGLCYTWQGSTGAEYASELFSIFRFSEMTFSKISPPREDLHRVMT